MISFILDSLTSMVLKYLHAALLSTWAEIVFVPVDVLNKMALWLAQQQDTEGKFIETAGYIYDRSFQVTIHNDVLAICSTLPDFYPVYAILLM